MTIILSMAEALMREMASPLSMPCVSSAKTVVAPSFFNSFAALVMVFAVSAKSSTRIQGRSVTSPTSIMVAFCRSEILVGRRSWCKKLVPPWRPDAFSPTL